MILALQLRRRRPLPSLVLVLVLGLGLGLPAAGQEFAGAAAGSLCPAGADALIDVPDPFSLRADAYRLLQLAGATAPRPLLLRRPSAETGAPVCARAARVLGWAITPNADQVRYWATGEFFHNSATPRDRNNGAVWAGVGSTAAATVGVRASWRWFDLQLAPRAFTAQNADFETIPYPNETRSPYGNRYHFIDWYQRPGEASRTEIEPGQSWLRATVGPVSAGVATENVWIGPARIYPILMSATAGGFPHVFLETARPIESPIGGLELRALWGRLDESDWFDREPDNDHRIFAALVAAWSPRWVPGLSVGGARAYHEVMVPGEFPVAHYLGTIIDPSFLGSGGGNRAEGNGLAAIFGRWAFPDVGFEVYGEWSREDTPWDLRDVLSEPDWTQAWALGFQQLIGSAAGSRAVRWYGELIHLGESAPLRAGRGLFSYYTHSAVKQGHTHRGQLLGAWIGPGSDAQMLGVDVLYPRGSSGFWIERNRFDDDVYYRSFADRFGESRHDVELVAGLRQLYSIAQLELEGSLTFGRRYNRYFIGLADETPEARIDDNWGLTLRAHWAPRGLTVF